MTTLRLTCLLADPASAKLYSDGLLDQKDLTRLQQAPYLSQRLDWQVSRVLKSQAASTAQSLSHSHGYAALLTADVPMPVGVDIERIKPRDFKALAAWVCPRQEQHYLAETDWQAEEFYRLWCIKEALVKAAGLNFPADMVRVGYAFQQGRISGLSVDGQNAWRGLSALVDREFAVACVWCSKQPAQIDWRFFGSLNNQALTNQQAV